MEEKNIQTKEDFHPAGKPIQQLLNLVPKEKRKQAELLAVKIEQHSVYSGPLPPAEQFAAYESILPGSAERILQMAEKQQSHRMQLEKEAISKDLDLNAKGQRFGFIALILLIGLSVLFAFLGMKPWAGVIGTTTIVIITSLFVGGKINIKKEIESK